MKHPNSCAPKANGYMALLSVLLIGTLGATLMSTLILLSLSQARGGGVSVHEVRARGLAESCAETALLNLKEDPSYAGQENLTLDGRQCTIRSIRANDPEYTIETQAEVEGVSQKIVIVATRTPLPTPTISITSWREVSDFTP